MDNAYANALGTVAQAYEEAVADRGGRSLSRVATIVASSGAFFNRLREGKSFTVENLNRFNDWFRRPGNWPDRIVPEAAANALASMGRPVLHDVDMPHVCGKPRTFVRPNDAATFGGNRT
jgi:hypothetical protein